ncbi:transcription termination factor Rho [Mycolicibacterium brumae]|uniref:Transcription termination factor Rho n=1 Tax=Mycolicibacterium brumae TaxID=85968 RepID=A0A2G5PAN7_9MYCO|nr:transcription termination factor Rho [Mycolicibacterium brumae]MCV7193040.1 transcription termination factor Rho [Mycolicibacterium brumae]PIB75431.1 transcription termination factor Rho [Mycolicibacterium brumae]UWW07958.1 transcription termination factor Rho [Mycolicibacterium brumae]
MTADSAVTSADSPASKSSKSGSLNTMLLPELRALAGQVGVKGVSGMRKGDLVAAIRAQQAGGAAPAKSEPAKAEPAKAEPAKTEAPAAEPAKSEPAKNEPAKNETASNETASNESSDNARAKDDDNKRARGDDTDDNASGEGRRRERRNANREAGAPSGQGGEQRNEGAQQRNEGGQQRNEGAQQRNEGGQQRNDGGQQRGGNANNSNNNAGGNNNSGNNNDDDDGRGGRRGRRFRDRRRRERGGSEGGDTELREDDVVQPVAGILDVLDNYAFVRTSGYLAGQNDVYVSMNMVRKNGLRRGDAVTGAVRVPREGEGGDKNQRQKFNPLVRLDTVNGGPVEAAKNRPEFGKLTPLYPNQRLRLETTPEKLNTRVIDLIMPIGKGQRALIVSPPKAGKTTIMQDIANAITRNNPECHLMVVLVDERPEEVTDMQRSVKGEVIASTFDRPPSDHTQAAELAIERAKRLVEQGKDVVVLLDSITRLGRAYNNASPASGRILSGGVDSTALYPPKRFLGAARNIEDGGSLTIIATAMVETGSTGDTVIFEEFKGTGNAELKLDRKIAERRVFPAVDVNPSGTRKDELLLGPDEFAIVHKLRRVLSGLDSHQAIDLLMSQLRKTKTNYEFLVQVSKTAPGTTNDND